MMPLARLFSREEITAKQCLYSPLSVLQLSLRTLTGLMKSHRVEQKKSFLGFRKTGQSSNFCPRPAIKKTYISRCKYI
ncbi:hypothetical protein MXB_1514 [Myxobolus squamalis]|nr:hypothetical protein MXB_1514 [Myxobolus squamalis]